MALITLDGMIEMFNCFLGVSNYQPKKLKLFTNNIIPTVNTIRSDLVALSANQYSAPTLNPEDWYTISQSGTVRAETSTIVLMLNAYSGGLILYGYYIENVDDGKVMWIEPFENPRDYPVDGVRITINPILLTENDIDE